MLLTTLTFLLYASSLALPSNGEQEVLGHLALKYNHSSDPKSTCHQIAAAISPASQVFFPPTAQYLQDMSHASASSSQDSVCSVEPGSTEDVSQILRILGSTRTPFAVKGGGHATNPNFSSTTGVLIALSRFNKTKINVSSGTVEVGAGLVWDQVYEALEPAGVNVVGGRVPGVGVAGLTLGGGYSYHSNQYGLSLDNVAGFELVLPNGKIVNVTSADDNLWFALRGGMNNFGIVTRFTLKSHPQSDIVLGGFFAYSVDQLDAIKDAFVKFQQKNDTKASIYMFLTYSSGQFSIALIIYYDAPTITTDVFKDLLAVPAIAGNLSQTSFSGFFQSLAPLVSFNGHRVFNHDAPVTQYSPPVVDTFVDQVKFWGERLYAQDSNTTLILALEPFDQGLFSHGSGSAYPPDRSHALFPSAISVQWSNASLDDTMAFALRDISDKIHAAALADGQDVLHATKYPNYALFGTPLEGMYGGNVERLHQIRAVVDQEDVMGLTGGWKF